MSQPSSSGPFLPDATAAAAAERRATRGRLTGDRLAPPFTCSYWVQKKLRHCKFPPVSSRPFCPLHDTVDRLPCAWCRAMIDTAFCAQHATICPVAIAARTREGWPFYRKSINTRPPSPSPLLPPPAAAHPPRPPSPCGGGSRVVDVEALLAKVQAALALHPLPPAPSLPCPPPAEDDSSGVPCARPSQPAQQVPPASSPPPSSSPPLPPPSDPPLLLSKMSRLRHSIQQHALVDLLLSRDLLPPHSTIVEMGAGRAGLSHVLLANPSASSSIAGLVLVDSEQFKATYDPRMRRAADIPVHRYRIDIADLYLPALPALSASPSSASSHAVLIGKHLCGGALDLSLHSVLHALHARTSMVASVLIASCCHHRCDWASYSGRAWLARWRVSEEELAVLCRMSSWACNDEDDSNRDRTARHHSAALDGHRTQAEGDVLSAVWGEEQARPGAAARVQIGKDVKAFLDLGRVQLLRDAGFDAELGLYVDERITRENRVLIARRPAHAACLFTMEHT